MAVKPITNKSVVAYSGVKREKQITTKHDSKSSNREASYAPGMSGKNYAITLKDVDTSIMNYVKNVIRPVISEASENIKVSVIYGNEERWKAARKRGVIRDKNGSLILPLIMLRRTDVEKSTTLPGFEHDIRREHIQVVRQNSWSKDNYYDRFSVLTNAVPKTESIVTTTPNFVNITYQFMLWTNFIEQMNPLIETFIEHNNIYWGDTTDHKFNCRFDSITDASEMNQDGERFIKSDFTILTNAYLLPEDTNSIITNKISQTQRVITPNKITFGFEGDATNKQVGKK